MTKINFNQISFSPDTPLGRIGCVIEEKLHWTHQSSGNEFFKNTPFQNFQNGFDKLNHSNPATDFRKDLKDFYNFYLHNFVDYVSVVRKIAQGAILERNTIIVQKLIKYQTLNDNLEFLFEFEEYGNLFECLVVDALADIQIQAYREVKIKYPLDGNQYDPDGQKYDVIGTLDISNFIWIECKKPTYLTDDPLTKMLSVENIVKFVRRANRLSPTIAVYLIDTKEDFRDRLKEIITYMGMKNELEIFGNSLDDLQNIMGVLKGKNYFLRVNFNSNKNYFECLKIAIQQVLYHSRFNRF